MTPIIEESKLSQEQERIAQAGHKVLPIPQRFIQMQVLKRIIAEIQLQMRIPRQFGASFKVEPQTISMNFVTHLVKKSTTRVPREKPSLRRSIIPSTTTIAFQLPEKIFHKPKSLMLEVWVDALPHVLKIKTAVPLNTTKRNGKELIASTFLLAMARIEQQKPGPLQQARCFGLPNHQIRRPKQPGGLPRWTHPRGSSDFC